MTSQMLDRQEMGETTNRARSALSGAWLWAGTVAFGLSTVALLATLSRHTGQSGFSDVAALLSLSFVVSLIPSGVQLRSAALVADGRPPPSLSLRGALLTTVVSLGVSPLLAVLLRVPVTATAIVTIQMVIAIPLAARQGALLGRHRFDALGTNLFIEGMTRYVLGALAGIAFGVTGLAFGLCAGTLVALVVIPRSSSAVAREDRPRTSLTSTSASLALLGLFVQLDVLVAPSVAGKSGAALYDLAAVPSKGVYLALLAAGPLLFPSVRRRPSRRMILGSAGATLAFGCACTGLLVVARHLVGAILGRATASPLELAMLGIAMSFAGVTGLAISAGIARGVRRPWPPCAVGIAIILACLLGRPSALEFSVVVLVAHALTTVLSMANSLRRSSPPRHRRRSPAFRQRHEQELELLAEAGDPFAAAQSMPSFAHGTDTEDELAGG